MDVTTLAIGVGVGLGLGYGIVSLFPHLLAERVRDQIHEGIRKKKAHEKAAMAVKVAEARVKHKGSLETYNAAITKADIARNTFISVLTHIKDQEEDVRQHEKMRHLVMIVFKDWNWQETPGWRDPSLVSYVSRMFDDSPHLLFYLESDSMSHMLEVIFTAENGLPDEKSDRPKTGTIEQIQKRFESQAKTYFRTLVSDEKKASAIVDDVLKRMDTAVIKLLGAPAFKREIFEVSQSMLPTSAASLHPTAPPAKLEVPSEIGEGDSGPIAMPVAMPVRKSHAMPPPTPPMPEPQGASLASSTSAQRPDPEAKDSPNAEAPDAISSAASTNEAADSKAISPAPITHPTPIAPPAPLLTPPTPIVSLPTGFPMMPDSPFGAPLGASLDSPFGMTGEPLAPPSPFGLPSGEPLSPAGNSAPFQPLFMGPAEERKGE